MMQPRQLPSPLNLNHDDVSISQGAESSPTHLSSGSENDYASELDFSPTTGSAPNPRFSFDMDEQQDEMSLSSQQMLRQDQSRSPFAVNPGGLREVEIDDVLNEYGDENTPVLSLRQPQDSHTNLTSLRIDVRTAEDGSVTPLNSNENTPPLNSGYSVAEDSLEIDSLPNNTSLTINTAKSQSKIPLSQSGLALLTHSYYYAEIKAGRLQVAELKTLSPAEVENLKSTAVMLFQKLHHLDLSTARKLNPGFRKLLEAPAYSQYFRLRPKAMATAFHVTEKIAKRLTSPYITNLLERKYSLDYLLELTIEELTVANNAIFGELFYRNASALPLIKGITGAEQHFLLEETIRTLIDKDELSIPEARAMIVGSTALTDFQMDLCLSPLCRPLFLQGHLSINRLRLMTSKNAHNLHDSQIIELIKNNVISLQDGMEMAPADKMLYRTPGIYKLLLGKIFTPQYASQLTPMMRRLLNTEPYTTFITNKPEFIGILQDWSETDLQRLFARTIIGLFNNNLLSLEHLRHPTPNFFPILYGNNIYQLLIKRNISLTQALNLTSATWSTIESHPNTMTLLRNSTDNNQQLDYIPYKIWSSHLSQRLFDLYRDRPQRISSHTDTLDIIKTQIDQVAEGESQGNRAQN